MRGGRQVLCEMPLGIRLLSRPGVIIDSLTIRGYVRALLDN